MGSKTRLSSYCTKRADNGVNLVTSRKINTRLACPITIACFLCLHSVLDGTDGRVYADADGPQAAM